MIKKINYIRKEKSIALLSFAPVLIGFLLFYFIPFIVSLYYSAVNSNYNHSIVFFDNYVLLFSNKSFLLALRNTIIFVALVVPAQMVLSFILSYLAASLKGMNNGRYPQPDIYMLQNFINNSFISLDYQKMTTCSVVVTVLVFAVLYFWILLNNKFCGDLV